MKNKVLYYGFVLILFLSSTLFVQADTVERSYTYNESISIGSTFEWIIQKYEIIERPTPEAYTFFKTDDIIKIEIIANPPTEHVSWGYHPDANFSDWMKFYKNDVYFNISEIEYLHGIFIYGFIYPITIIEDEVTTEFFEYYVDVVKGRYFLDLSLEAEVKLSEKYFEEIVDSPRGYIGRQYFSREYNINTGILCEYKEEYDNLYGTKYKIIIVNTVDTGSSATIIIPIVTLVVTGIIFQKRRKGIKKN